MRSELMRPFGVIAAGAVVLGAFAITFESGRPADPVAAGRAEAIAQAQSNKAARADAVEAEARYQRQVAIDQAYIKLELDRLKKQEPGFAYDVVDGHTGRTFRTNIPVDEAYGPDNKGRFKEIEECAAIIVGRTQAGLNDNKKKPAIKAIGGVDSFGDSIEVNGAVPALTFIAKEAAMAYSFRSTPYKIVLTRSSATCVGGTSGPTAG